jgi:hypothetical protein
MLSKIGLMLQITTALWLSSLRCANDFPVEIRKIWQDAVTAFSCSCPYDTSLDYFDAANFDILSSGTDY